jgi:hypothetical protein
MSIHDDSLRPGVAADGTRGTNTHAGCGIAVAALVRKGHGQVQTWHDVHPRRGPGLFENGLEKILVLSVFYSAGDFAVPAANAPLRVDKDCFHMGTLLGWFRETWLPLPVSHRQDSERTRKVRFRFLVHLLPVG